MIVGQRYVVRVKRSPSVRYTGRYIGDAPSPLHNEWSHVFGPVEECGVLVYVAENNFDSADAV